MVRIISSKDVEVNGESFYDSFVDGVVFEADAAVVTREDYYVSSPVLRAADLSSYGRTLAKSGPTKQSTKEIVYE